MLANAKPEATTVEKAPRYREWTKLPLWRPPYQLGPPAWALSWIAFGSSFPKWSWDRYLYPGAGLWPYLSPDDLDGELVRVQETAGNPHPQILPGLHSWADEGERARIKAKTTPDDEIRLIHKAAALRWHQALHSADPKIVDAMWHRLCFASAELRQSAARGEIAVYVSAHVDDAAEWALGMTMMRDPNRFARRLLRVPRERFGDPQTFGLSDLLPPMVDRSLVRMSRMEEAGIPVFLDGAELNRQWPDPDPKGEWSAGKTDVTSSPPPPLPAPPVNRGGRAPKHDWDAFWQEAARWAAENELHTEERPRLQRHMAEWTAEQWADPPDEATIRKKLAGLYGR